MTLERRVEGGQNKVLGGLGPHFGPHLPLGGLRTKYESSGLSNWRTTCRQGCCATEGKTAQPGVLPLSPKGQSPYLRKPPLGPGRREGC